jgi:hypothetical protein
VPLARPSPFQGAPIGLSGNSLYRFLSDQLSFSRTHWLVSNRRV